MTTPPSVVTIGLPVYNGEKTLATVLDSLLSQTCREFRIVISDNASTDGTERICREYAQRDERITYIRQSENLGIERNFDFVLSVADTEFFMWAAADDIRSEDFLDLNLRFLQENPEFIGSTCPVRFEGGEFDAKRMGDQTLDDSNSFNRMLGFFGAWHANGRLFSLLRTEAVRDARLSRLTYLGGDWTFILTLLAKGKFKRVNRGSVVLGRNGISNSTDVYARYRTRLISWIVPLYELSLDVLKLSRGANLNQRAKLVSHLLSLNTAAFKGQLKYALKKSN